MGIRKPVNTHRIHTTRVYLVDDHQILIKCSFICKCMLCSMGASTAYKRNSSIDEKCTNIVKLQTVGFEISHMLVLLMNKMKCTCNSSRRLLRVHQKIGFPGVHGSRVMSKQGIRRLFLCISPCCHTSR